MYVCLHTTRLANGVADGVMVLLSTNLRTQSFSQTRHVLLFLSNNVQIT